MEFCEKCGGLLVSKKTSNGAQQFVCRICGRKYDKGSKIKITEKINREENIKVIEKQKQELPTTEISCPKCENNEAYWWLQQTRSVDEPPTRFYKCTKCGNTWREYS